MRGTRGGHETELDQHVAYYHSLFWDSIFFDENSPMRDKGEIQGLTT